VLDKKKFDSWIENVRNKSGNIVNPYALCIASITEETKRRNKKST
jgi:hypothetical protein